jgi:hypothetical protein
MPGLKPGPTSEAKATANAMARTEADPYGMTNKKDNFNDKCKNEIQGFFASLRMTTSWVEVTIF